MKIVDVRVRRYAFQRSYGIANALSSHLGRTGHQTIVEVFTDEGITGVLSTHMFDELCGQIVAKQLKPLLLGEDPLNYERLWTKMFGAEAKWRAPIAKGEVVRAISAVDCAIWDIIGKSLQLPLCQLLGGSRDRVACYASGGHYTSLDSASDELKHLEWEMGQYMARGFRAVKMRVGRDLTSDIERVRLVREVIGPATRLMIDFNTSPSHYGGLPHALRYVRKLEPFDIYWFEDPLVMDDIAGFKQLSDAVDTSIATGEYEQTLWGFRDLIVNKAVDILLPDATQMCGGITVWRKIAAMAEAYRIPVAAHIGDGTHVHCVAAVPNGLMVEVFTPLDQGRSRHELHPVAQPDADGLLVVPSTPGNGLELDDAYLAKQDVLVL